MDKHNDEAIVYEHCKDCDGIECCLDLARAPEPWFTIKCPVFSTLKRILKGE